MNRVRVWTGERLRHVSQPTDEEFDCHWGFLPTVGGVVVVYTQIPQNLRVSLAKAYELLPANPGPALFGVVWVGVAAVAVIHGLIAVDLAKRTWEPRKTIRVRGVAAVLGAIGWGFLGGLPAWISMDLNLGHVLPYENQLTAWSWYPSTFIVGAALVVVALALALGSSFEPTVLQRPREEDADAQERSS